MGWQNRVIVRPYSEVDLRVPKIPMRVMPGKLACLSHPKNAHTGLHLAVSGSVSANMCERCGETVVEKGGLRWPNQENYPCFACGGKVRSTKVARERLVKDHQDPDIALVVQSEIEGFEPGEVIVVAPQHGLYNPAPEEGWDGWDKREMRILPAVGWPWYDTILGKLTKDGFEWTNGWLLVERELRPECQLGLETPDSSKMGKWAKVGTDHFGRRVAWDEEHTYTFTGMDAKYALVKSQHSLRGVA